MDLAVTFSGIAISMSATFGGPYVAATLKRATLTRASGGDMTETTEDVPCQAQVDRVTEQMRNDPRYTEADVRILILAATLAGDAVSDDTIVVNAGPLAGSYKLMAPIERDAMAVYHDCAGKAL
jgi:hypothetical protein